MFAGWIILSIFPGIIAKNKGYQFFPYFLISLILSPIVGFIWVLVMKPSEAGQVEAGEARKCPFCAEMVKPDAIVCRYCHKDLPPPDVTKPKVILQPTPIDRKAANKGRLTVLLILIGIAIIGLLFDYFLNGYKSIVWPLIHGR